MLVCIDKSHFKSDCKSNYIITDMLFKYIEILAHQV